MSRRKFIQYYLYDSQWYLFESWHGFKLICWDWQSSVAYSSCRKPLLFYHCSSCYCFRARDIVSVVCSIVLSKGCKPFMWDLERAAPGPISGRLFQFSAAAYLEGIHTCKASQNMPWILSNLQGRDNRSLHTVLFDSLHPALHLHCILTIHSKDRKAVRSLQGVLYKKAENQ